VERKGGLRAAALRLRSTLRSFAANFLFARLEVNNEAVNRRRRCDRELKPESRSLLLERPDEEDGHQRGDADGEDQQGQLLGLALSLPGARLGFHGFHDDASLPHSAIPSNGPTVDGTGVTYLKFLGGGREVSDAPPASSIRPDSRGGPPHGAHRLALVAAPLGRHQFPLESRFGRDQAQVRIQLRRKSSRHPVRGVHRNSAQPSRSSSNSFGMV
jgi:hypothetical protein